MGSSKEYYLLGRYVNKQMFEKYNNERFPFFGRMLGLDSIHLFATDEEIARQFPAQAAEAKAIIANIERDIDAAQNSGKRSFHSFMEALQDIFKTEMEKRNAGKKAFEIAEADYKATMDDPKAPEYIRVIALGDFERAKMTWKQIQQDAQDNFKAKTGALRAQMADYAADVYRADPSKIDHNALQLLNADIMSPDEVEHLADNYRDNPTMLRLIGKYAADKFNSTLNERDRTRGAKWASLKGLQTLSDSSAAIAGFDYLADFCRKVFLDDRSAESRYYHFDRMYHSACAAYDDFIIQPDGGAAAEAHKETVAKLNAATMVAAQQNLDANRESGNVVHVVEGA